MSQEQADRTRTVIVVGAGPVGCLAAISFAKMGWDVDIYEARPGKLLICVLVTDWFQLVQICGLPPPRPLPSSARLTSQYHLVE